MFIAEHNLFTSQLHIGILSEMKEIVKCIYFPLRAFYANLYNFRCFLLINSHSIKTFVEKDNEMSPDCYLSRNLHAILYSHSLHFAPKGDQKFLYLQEIHLFSAQTSLPFRVFFSRPTLFGKIFHNLFILHTDNSGRPFINSLPPAETIFSSFPVFRDRASSSSRS